MRRTPLLLLLRLLFLILPLPAEFWTPERGWGGGDLAASDSGELPELGSSLPGESGGAATVLTPVLWRESCSSNSSKAQADTVGLLFPHDETGNQLSRWLPGACGGTRIRVPADEDDGGDRDDPEREPVSASLSLASSLQQLPHVARPR